MDTTDDAFNFCERVYREVGVTPALRRVYEFYLKHRALTGEENEPNLGSS